MGKTSELHIQIQDELIHQIDQTHEGYVSFLDTLIFIEQERKQLENSLALIKSFKDENLNSISSESDEHKEGYKGHTFEIRNGGRIFNYKGIDAWETCKKGLKDCEDRYKQAFISKEKGMMVATEDGEEIELPTITYRKSSVIVKAKK